MMPTKILGDFSRRPGAQAFSTDLHDCECMFDVTVMAGLALRSRGTACRSRRRSGLVSKSGNVDFAPCYWRESGASERRHATVSRAIIRRALNKTEHPIKQNTIATRNDSFLHFS
jgi:hypothetical protein